MGMVIPSLHRKEMFQGEKHFIHEHPGLKLIYEPITVLLSNGDYYTPDFWCSQLNSYIEIAATRQAHEQDKIKIDLFRAEYGALIVLSAEGNSLQPNIISPSECGFDREWMVLRELAALLGAPYNKIVTWIRLHPDLYHQRLGDKGQIRIPTENFEAVKAAWESYVPNKKTPKGPRPGKLLKCCGCGKEKWYYPIHLKNKKTEDYRCWSCYIKAGGTSGLKKLVKTEEPTLF